MLKRILSAACLLFMLTVGLTACDAGGANEEEPDDGDDGQEQTDGIPAPPGRPSA